MFGFIATLSVVSLGLLGISFFRKAGQLKKVINEQQFDSLRQDNAN